MTPLPDGDLIRVSQGPYCYGLIVRDGIVVWAAPVARWAVGEDEWKVARYLRQRGAQFVRLGP